MARYRSKRNAEGFRVDQIWYALDPKGIDSDQIEVVAVFGDSVHVRTVGLGKHLQSPASYINEHYSLSPNGDLDLTNPKGKQ